MVSFDSHIGRHIVCIDLGNQTALNIDRYSILKAELLKRRCPKDFSLPSSDSGEMIQYFRIKKYPFPPVLKAHESSMGHNKVKGRHNIFC